MMWHPQSTVRPAEPDPTLAAFFAKHGVKPDFSRILQTDALATALNRERLGARRIVDLSCGHKAVTRKWRRILCPRCAEMIRQGMDYEAWINRREHAFDGMIWRDDPVRGFNERTDLEGAFVDDPEEAAP